MMTGSLVSVIVPTLNMGHFLDAALTTVERQNYPNLEVIVADCQSTDQTRDIVATWSRRGLRTKHLSCPKNGPGPARNAALAAAQGDVVAFLDADDLWPSGKLDRQLTRLHADPAVDMVSGYVTYFDKAGPDGLVPATDARTESLFGVNLGCCLYRRTALDAIGHFDPDFVYAEDVDLFLRLIESGRPFTILRSIELYYRKHGDSMMSQQSSLKTRDMARAKLKSLQRRRTAGTDHIPLKQFTDFLEPT